MPYVSPSRVVACFVALTMAGVLGFPAFARADSGTCTDSWISGGSGSWFDPTNWSDGVPTNTDDVCIDLDGNYTVTLNGYAVVNSLSLGRSSSVGIQELDVVAPPEGPAGLQIADDSTIGITGSLVLDSQANGYGVSFGGGGTTISDYGSIESQIESTATNTITSNVDVEPGGTLVDSTGELDADGTITNQGGVSAAGTLYVYGASFDNRGSVYNNGTLKLYDGTWSQDGGSESGNPVTLFDCGFLGNAPGSTGAFDLTGGVSVTGAITADETLTVLGTPGLAAYANLQYDVVNDGTIVLDASGSGAVAAINGAQNPANELTNDGTLDASATSGGSTQLQSDLENTGTVEVQAGDLVLNAAATATNDSTLTVDPAAEFEVSGGTFDEQSDGVLTFGITGPSTYGSFTVDAGQTFNLNGGAVGVDEEGYTPEVGAEFDVISGAYGTGRFTTVPSGFLADYSNAAMIGLIVAPAVSGLSPNSGSTAGGTPVMITGTNLAGAAAVDFGGVPGTITSDSATQITAVSPAAAAAGTVDVTVMVNGVTSSTNSSDQFTYQADVVNKTAPTISGTTQDGATLTATHGVWSAPSALTYSYRWLLCDSTGANCAAISGAIGHTFKLTSADVAHQLEVVVTATDKQGEQAQATAVPVGPVQPPAAPTATTPPQISGQLRDGVALHVVNGSWSSPDHLTYAYQWELCDGAGQNCAPTGATGTTFLLTSADVGHEIAVLVTATDQEGQQGQASAGPVGPVTNPAPPSNTALPVISGRFIAGQTLKTTNGKWSSPDHLAYTYQWEDCNSAGQSCVPIAGAQGQSYKLKSGDLSGTVTVVVTATDQEQQAGQATAQPYPTNPGSD